MINATVPSAARAAPLQVTDEKYSAHLFLDGGPRVHFHGTISTVNPATVLNPFVDAVHHHVVDVGAKEIRVDLTGAGVLQLLRLQVLHPLDRADPAGSRTRSATSCGSSRRTRCAGSGRASSRCRATA